MKNPSLDHYPVITVNTDDRKFVVSVGYETKHAFYECKASYGVQVEHVLREAQELKAWYANELANQKAAHLLEVEANKA